MILSNAFADYVPTLEELLTSLRFYNLQTAILTREMAGNALDDSPDNLKAGALASSPQIRAANQRDMVTAN